MKFKPLRDRVLLDILPEEEMTAGGIIIPDVAKDKPPRATVLAVGEGERNRDGEIIPLIVKVGDVVILPRWSGTTVTIGFKDYAIIKESELLGIEE